MCNIVDYYEREDVKEYYGKLKELVAQVKEPKFAVTPLVKTMIDNMSHTDVVMLLLRIIQETK